MEVEAVVEVEVAVVVDSIIITAVGGSNRMPKVAPGDSEDEAYRGRHKAVRRGHLD